MASLLDPLPDDALSFLRVIADGYAAAGGCCVLAVGQAAVVDPE